MSNHERMNTRILVIDDEESIRDGFQVILGAQSGTNRALDAAASLLFDDTPVKSPPRPAVVKFNLDVVPNGHDGITRVRQAIDSGDPYAVIFCDIRMPGIDGVETIEEIRQLDTRAEVVFITAYSDHSIETIVDRAGANVSYFIKPFVTEEARQLATKLVLDWNRARELEDLMTAVSSLRGRAKDVDRILQHLLRQTCAWLDTDSAALFRQAEQTSFQFCLGVGELDVAKSTEWLESIKTQLEPSTPITILDDGRVVLRVDDFGLLVALPGRSKITPDRRTLLFAFLQHAALAIKNRELEVELELAQRMAGIGQAVGYLLHDLRHPIGTTQMLLRMLREQPDLFGTIDEAYEMMELENQRGLDMVGDILALCQAEIRIQTTAISLHQALSRALRIWRIQLSTRNIEFVVDIPDDISIRVDVARLERALSNLIKNASEVVLAGKLRRIELTARSVDLGVEIDVADSGAGIPSQVLEKLFEPFSTAEKHEGMGFGLAIVKQVMDAHAGRVEVKRVDNMTRFTLFFPNNSPS